MIELYPLAVDPGEQYGLRVQLESGASPQDQIDATIAKFVAELDKDNNGDPVVHAGSGTKLSERLYQEQYWLEGEEEDEEGNMPPPHYRVGVSKRDDASPTSISYLALWVGILTDDDRPATYPTVAYDKQLLDAVFARMAP